MKRFLFFKLLVTLIFFYSCKKESGTGTSPEPSSKVKTLTEEINAGSLHYISTSNLSYDGQDRLISMQSDSAHTNFAYENNLVKKDWYQTGLPDQHFYYYLNAMSLADSVVSYFGNTDTLHSIYLYNSKNQLVKIISTDVNRWGSVKDTSEYEYNSDGDLSKLTFGNAVNSYQYYDKPNFHNSASMINPGVAPNSKLLKTASFTYMGIDPSTSNFTYTFDDYNRVRSITDVTTGALNTETMTTTYTYY